MSNSRQARLLRIKVTPTWLTAFDWEDYKYWIEGQVFGLLWIWWLLHDWHNWAHALEGRWKLHCAVVPEKLAPMGDEGFRAGNCPPPYPPLPGPQCDSISHTSELSPNWVAVVTGTKENARCFLMVSCVAVLGRLVSSGAMTTEPTYQPGTQHTEPV